MDIQGHAFLQELTATLNEQNSKMMAYKDERPVILVTTVDIGGGKSDKIEFRKGDEPTDSAKAFCRKHGLPATIVGPLTQHILDHLKRANVTPDGKSLTQESKPGLGMPFPTESPIPSDHPSINSKGGKGGKNQFSFASGGNDDKLFEQLSNKLMPVDQARHDTRNMLSATELLSSDNSRHRSSSSGNPRKPVSAGPSPRVRGGDVHNRLYNYAHDKQMRLEERRKMQEAEEIANMVQSRQSMSWISSEMMKQRDAGMYENYGEMLYAEGVESWMVKRRKADLERSARAEKELEGATFQPAITKKAWELKMRESSIPDRDASEKWNRMYSRGMTKATIERLEELRRAREDAEVKECTFKPRINRSSEAMMSERSETLKVLNISHHDQLFQDALRRQQKMAELANWFPDEVTFQPAINKDGRAKEYLRRSWERVARDSPRASVAAGNGESVVERLYACLEKRNKKLEEARAALNGPVDPVTGKQLYKPETGRAPKNIERNRDGKPIGEYLYSVAQELAAKKQMTEEEERRAAEEEASRARLTETSKALFLRLKLKRFIQIFEYLDESGVGVIDLVGLVRERGPRVERLDNEVLLDVETAAAIWAKANGSSVLDTGASAETGSADQEVPLVDQDNFLAVMEQALNARRAPRAYLVPSPSAKSAPSHTFQPAINKRSKQIAAKLRTGEVAVHELLHQTAVAQREKMQARRKLNEDAELRDCTFQPRLNPASHSVEGRALRLSKVGSVVSGGKNANNGATASTANNNGAAANGGSGDSSVGDNEAEEMQLQEFARLEQELSDMMAATTLAQQRLVQLEGEEATSPNAAASAEASSAAAQAALMLEGLDEADSTALQAQMDGLLLDALQTGDEAAVTRLTAMETAMEQLLAQKKANAAASSSHAGSAASSRRGTKEQQQAGVAGASSVSTFVLPSGSNGGASMMQDLAKELDSWPADAL